MEKIKALFFDVGGTVFDWKNTVKNEIAALAAEHQIELDAEKFAKDWRATMFRIHNEVRNGNLPWMNSDEMDAHALEQLTARYPILGTVDQTGLVRSTWHNLRVFEGAADSIARLRTQYTVSVLTILCMESIVSSSKRGSVIWDAILSCELLGYYKPSLQAYKEAIRIMGFQPQETVMVAAHMGDLASAAQVGMRTVYVQVPEEDHVEEGFSTPDTVKVDYEAAGFNALCEYFNV